MNDRIAGTFWLVIGAYAAIHGYHLGVGRLHRPGPGFIFFLSALALVILSAINLALTFVGKSNEQGKEKEASLWQGIQWHKVLFVLGTLAAYTCFFTHAGFALSTFLLMILLYKGVEYTRWWIAIASSFLTVFVSYVIFVKWLEVPFPTGFLGF